MRMAFSFNLLQRIYNKARARIERVAGAIFVGYGAKLATGE